MDTVSRDEQFMRDALREAQQSAREGEIPVGGVVVCKGRIIARAHNLTETLTDPTAHAEMQLVGMAADALGGKYLTDCTLYVTLEPCPMCAAALAWDNSSGLSMGLRTPRGDTPSSLPPCFTPEQKSRPVSLLKNAAPL